MSTNSGWQLDLEYKVPRIIFKRKEEEDECSTCYVYTFEDIDEHVKSCGLTNLEYLEGKSFYREHAKEINKNA